MFWIKLFGILSHTHSAFMTALQKILLARPGGNYTGYSGLDLSLGANVHEYQIDPQQTPYRVWMSSESSIRSTMTAGVDLSPDCFTAMHVTASNIKGQAFNFSGTDDMLWAANGEDYFMMYHGANRGRFSIHWPTGKVTLLSAPPFEESVVTAPPAYEVSGSQRVLSLSWVVLVAGLVLGRLA
jgi:hypothetical protein